MAPLIVELRRKPGHWAHLATYRSNNGAGTSMKKAHIAFPDIQFTARRLDGGGSSLYGRFVEEE